MGTEAHEKKKTTCCSTDTRSHDEQRETQTSSITPTKQGHHMEQHKEENWRGQDNSCKVHSQSTNRLLERTATRLSTNRRSTASVHSRPFVGQNDVTQLQTQ